MCACKCRYLSVKALNPMDLQLQAVQPPGLGAKVNPQQRQSALFPVSGLSLFLTGID